MICGAPKHVWAKEVVTFGASDGFSRRCKKGKPKRITKQKSRERRNSPHLSASGGGFAGFGYNTGKVLLIGFIMAFFVLLATAAPARVVTPKIHG